MWPGTGTADRSQHVHAHSHDKLLTRAQTLTIFAFVVLAFALLAFRSEVNARHGRDADHRVAVNQWAGCVRGNDILRQFNDLNLTIAGIERQQIINLALAQARIDAYTKAVVPLADCGPRP